MTDRLRMRRTLPPIAVLFLAILLAAGISHLLVNWLGIRTGVVRHRIVGEAYSGDRVFLAGSSLVFDAFAMDEVADRLQKCMETWFVAGSSPPEWEAIQPKTEGHTLTLIGVSAYDLNEDYLCDFRSQVVDIAHTTKDLFEMGADWPTAKRILSQYPLKYIRFLFPTAGRSQGVMGGLKEKLQKMIGRGASSESDAGPTVAFVDGNKVPPEKMQSITDWTPGDLARRLAKMRAACQGRHSYDGLKKLALKRLLGDRQKAGQVVVAVLPVSNSYRSEFINEQTNDKFEALIADLQASAPGVRWLRIDQLPGIGADDNFYDAVHMNIYGERAATAALLKSLN